jgi:hypothetical protein
MGQHTIGGKNDGIISTVQAVVTLSVACIDRKYLVNCIITHYGSWPISDIITFIAEYSGKPIIIKI